MTAFRYICASISSLLVCACGPAPGPDPETDLSLAGCTWSSAETGGTDGVGNFESLTDLPEFQAYLDIHVAEDQENARWIIEGDIAVSDFRYVIAAYQRYHAAGNDTDAEGGAGMEAFRSTVACDLDHEIDLILNPSQKLALTYCLDEESWGDVPAFRAAAIAELARSTAAWESAADINFIELEHGENCSHANGAYFVVEYSGKECTLFGCKLGNAFFPNEVEALRAFEYYEDAFDSPEQLTSTTSHELGHILGLWHEHARFDGALCSIATGDPGQWRGVTEADPHSIMAYAHCVETAPLPEPTPLDRAGLALLYNLPRTGRGFSAQAGGALMWHRPAEGEYVVWSPTDGPNQSIEFIESTDCYYPDCSPGSAPYWKPILYRNETSVDVLMLGPGDFEERRFRDIEGVVQSEVPAILGSNTDVPILLENFFGPSDRSIWWIRPSAASDQLWRNIDGAIHATTDFDVLPFTDEHYSAASGKFLTSRGSLIWLSPTSLATYLTTFDGGFQQFPFDKSLCGLQNSIAYNGIVGEFDGDGKDEIIWYDHTSGAAVYWKDLPNCFVPTSFNVGQAKPAAFRVNGNRDSLMLYRPEHQTVQFYDIHFDQLTPPLVIPADAAPVLRDFDQDGCMDILWFTPHLLTSRLWQSNCDATFDETFVDHPPSAYPLGYGPGHGRN